MGSSCPLLALCGCQGLLEEHLRLGLYIAALTIGTGFADDCAAKICVYVYIYIYTHTQNKDIKEPLLLVIFQTSILLIREV